MYFKFAQEMRWRSFPLGYVLYLESVGGVSKSLQVGRFPFAFEIKDVFVRVTLRT